MLDGHLVALRLRRVPEGPGLGVTYDWDFITRHSQGKVTVAADS